MTPPPFRGKIKHRLFQSELLGQSVWYVWGMSVPRLESLSYDQAPYVRLHVNFCAFATN